MCLLIICQHISLRWWLEEVVKLWSMVLRPLWMPILIGWCFKLTLQTLLTPFHVRPCSKKFEQWRGQLSHLFPFVHCFYGFQVLLYFNHHFSLGDLLVIPLSMGTKTTKFNQVYEISLTKVTIRANLIPNLDHEIRKIKTRAWQCLNNNSTWFYYKNEIRIEQSCGKKRTKTSVE